MSMDALPPEILARVISFVKIEQKQLAPFATISRAWQHVVEQHTFSHLSFFSDELKTFGEAVIESPHADRRAAVRSVHFGVKLPGYDDKACGRFERRADRRANDEAFSQAITGLFAALATLDTGGGSKSIDLRLLYFHSAMDVDQRDKAKLKADKLAHGTGKRPDLFELRYKSSYIQLLRSENLPSLYNVASLTVAGDSARKLAPAVAPALMAKLPRLVYTDLSFSDMERKRSDRRMQLRSEFSKQLRSIDVPKGLRTCELAFRHAAPANEDFANADVRGSACLPGDDLSAALHRFTQAPGLTRITLSGPICVGPELFWPEGKEKEPQWHELKVVSVEVSAVRPDGGWYTDLDPNRGGDSSDEDDEDDDEEASDSDKNSDDQDSDEIADTSSEQSSGYGSNESFFAMDELPPDSYGYPEEKRDLRLNGHEPVRRFRTQPNAELEKLFAAAASAAGRMPELRNMRVTLQIHPSRRTGRKFNAIGFVYLAVGVKHPRDLGAGDRERRRLYWDGPRGWRMGRDLEDRWRVLLGEDGIVRYNEFAETGFTG